MKNDMVGARWRTTPAIAAKLTSTTAVMALAIAATTALSAPAWATTAPAVVAQTTPPPPPPPPPADLAPPPVAAEPAPPPPAPGPDPASPGFKDIHTGVALRVGTKIQGATDPSKLNDFGIDELTLELRFHGALTPMFSWQANFNAVYPDPTVTAMTTGGRPPVFVQDLIGKLEVMPEFQVWAGRMLVPSDRSNFSGPWFMSAWNFPGFFPGITTGPVGPIQGLFGRNDGITIWGDIQKGKFKYFVGVFDLDQPARSPLFTSRFNLALIGAEPGYYHSSTYYGSQDIVAVGVGGQYQKDGFGPGANLTTFYVDALAEKNLGPGVGTVEGQYYHFSNGYQLGIKNSFFLLGSFLINEKVGIGRVQPLVRWQQALRTSPLPSEKILDIFATYVIDDYFLRFAVGYQRSDPGAGAAANAIQFGLQMQR